MMMHFIVSLGSFTPTRLLRTLFTKVKNTTTNGALPALGGWALLTMAASPASGNEPQPVAQTAAAQSRPNVLFIALDDLNDWIGVLGGHPQTITPNFDRLAKSGVLFTNAHTAAPSCNPSRTSIMTGISPHVSGIYLNNQPMRQLLPEAEIIPKTFARHGFKALGSGKILHYFIDAPSWDTYFPEAARENPFPRTLYPETRPLSLPRAGNWQYVETDWGPLAATDEEYGGDYLVTDWVGQQLQQQHDQPFFLACGIYRPHEPWFVPAKYFEPFPLESIQLPPGYKADDLDDLPPEGRRRGPNQYLEHIRQHGQWKQGIQAYLASIHFADAMLGRVLDALESGPNAKNTIVVLWSDHGWHLGEKEHWQKYTAWRVCTRVPLMVRVPEGTPGLPSGTQAETVVEQPVSLLSLFPTLLQLSGLPAETQHDGPSLVPLLENAEANWPHVALTYLGDPGSYGLSARNWRLIHYANGDEELYHIEQDPYEWDNLAPKPEFADKLAELRALAPKNFAPLKTLDLTQLPALDWHPTSSSDALPETRPQGNLYSLPVINQSKQPVRLIWVSPTGEKVQRAEIAPGAQTTQRTRAGVVWLVTDLKDQPLGYFHTSQPPVKAVIPENTAE